MTDREFYRSELAAIIGDEDAENLLDELSIGNIYVNESIGSTGFAMLSQDDYMERQRFEKKFLIAKFEELFPKLPDGVYFAWKGFPHDFGTYHELCLHIDENNSKHWELLDTMQQVDMDAFEEEIELLWQQEQQPENHSHLINPDNVE